MKPYEEEEEDNNPFTGVLAQMDFPFQKQQEEAQQAQLYQLDHKDDFIDLPLTKGSGLESAVTDDTSVANSSGISGDSKVDNNPENRSTDNQSTSNDSKRNTNSSESSQDAPLIAIVDANKTSDGHSTGGFITYTISYNDTLIRRRYREFESLRNSLVALFPTIIVPPIPTKQKLSEILSSATLATSKAATGSSNLVNSTNNLDGFGAGGLHTSINIIDHRRRMLSMFLRRCLKIERIRNCEPFQKFLNPNLNWNDVLNQPPLSLIPKNPLQCDPIHPERSQYLHSVMPVPSTSPFTASTPMNILSSINKTATSTISESSHETRGASPPRGHRRLSSAGDEKELSSRTVENSIMNELDKVDKKCNKYIAYLSSISSELGILFNALSLQESDQKSEALLLEKVSTNYDQAYLNLENLYQTLYLQYSEPLMELSQFSDITKKLIKFKNKKLLQLSLIDDELAKKEKSLKNLTVGYSNWENPKLNDALNKFDNLQEQPDQTPAAVQNGKFKIPGVNRLTSVFRDRIYDSDPVKTHRDKVNKLIFEIDQLKKIQEIAGRDFKALEAEISNELASYERYFKTIELKAVLLQFVRNVLELSRKNLENWEEFQAVLNKQ